jgi:hypothetical protein
MRDTKATRAEMLLLGGKAQLRLRDEKQNLVFIAPPADEPIQGKK